MATAMTNAPIKMTTAFYLELLMLAFPTLILVNGFIDAHKRGEPDNDEWKSRFGIK